MDAQADAAPLSGHEAGILDKWWPHWSVISVATVFMIALLCSMPGAFGFVLVIPAAVGLPVAALSTLVIAVALAIERRPRRAGSMAVAAALPFVLLPAILRVTVYAHLALTAWIGVGCHGPAPAPDDDGLTVYDWSIGLAGGPSTFLPFDPMDRLARRPLDRTAPCDSGGFVEECADKSKHLVGHYYVCSF